MCCPGSLEYYERVQKATLLYTEVYPRPYLEPLMELFCKNSESR